MKRYIYIIATSLCALFLSSCAKEIVDLTGSINGTIKDYRSGALIANCMVSLSPGGKAVTSSASGTYEFTDLTPGDYSLTFSRAGYYDEKTAVTVVAASTVTADVLLKMKSAFDVSESSYDFGDLEATKTFYFYNNSDSDCSYEISNVPAWLSFDRTRGTVSSSGSEAVTATVLRDKVNEGSYNQNVTITYSGKSSGVITLYLKMSKVRLTTPTVEIAYEGQNIKENSFDIVGTITATGGSQILSYGHCWSTSQNPTVDNYKTDLGMTSALGSFTSTANNLTVFTTYYVRAYARNAQGIAYSDQIAVTTQDVGSDKWDGNIASSFEGGSGTYSSPYIIKTGGQLLLAKNYSDKYFELGGNIDLDNKNWLPYSFEGNLDGKGYTIFNLYVNRQSSGGQGLFSECYGGFVSNLTINGVSINAVGANYSYVGAISGEGGTIKNCKVILGGSSALIGDDYVGGISGRNASVSGCVVESPLNSAVIKGTSRIGGILGSIDQSGTIDIDNLSVKCNISGKERVGGIVGYAQNATIQNCSYEGTIMGEHKVGGLVGDSYTPIIRGCKSNATITATNGDAGGLVGYSTGYHIPDIYGCYSTGTISATGRACGLGLEIYAYLSYSAMTCTSPTFYALALSAGFHLTDCASVQDCSDITTYLKECYSEYASYWNFNSSWTWEGMVNGSSKQVKCPKLAWE